MQSTLTTLLASSLKGDHSTHRAHTAAPFPGRTETDAGVHNMTPLAEAARAVDRNGKMGEGEPKQQEGHQGQGEDPQAETRVFLEEFIEGEGFQRGFVQQNWGANS